jgi:hypothetical protein
MTTAVIPTVEELTARIKEAGWADVNARADAQALASIEPALRIRQRAVNVPTIAPVGYYWNPTTEKAAVFLHDLEKTAPSDIHCCRRVIGAAGFHSTHPALTEKEASDGDWIKVAFSPTLRTIGEGLNFFPGYGPLPNQAGPLAGMLTSGLVGAGLGYGGGWLAEKLLPDNWERGKLRRTLAILGGALGAAPGAYMGLQNWAIGRPFNDPRMYNMPPRDYHASRLSMWERPPYGDKQPEPGFKEPKAEDSLCKEANDALDVSLGQRWKDGAKFVAEKAAADRDAMLKEAFGPYAPVFGQNNRRNRTDINVNSLGQALWDVGSTPGTAAMTMGAVHAANQMPGGEPDSGWVTPVQMGRLGAAMGAGYLSGGLVGSVLGALTGLPQGAQDKLKETGMYLGIVKDVVPTLFGR